jgi:hypothetical protein
VLAAVLTAVFRVSPDTLGWPAFDRSDVLSNMETSSNAFGMSTLEGLHDLGLYLAQRITECAAEMNSDPTCQNAWAASLGAIAQNWQNSAQALPSAQDRALANSLGRDVNALGNVFGQMGNELQNGHGGCALGTGLGLLYGMAMFGGLDADALAADAAKLADLDNAIDAANAVNVPGTLQIIGDQFSASEMNVAKSLAAEGKNVILRIATGEGRTSDLLVDRVEYDVYTPQAGTPVTKILNSVARKWTQVNGGGVVVDLTQTGLSEADFGNALARVNGFIRSWGGTLESAVVFYGGK